MAIGILGKKIGMTQLFQEDGKLIPVTVIEAGPCPILQVKSIEKDGYAAVLLGFEDNRKVKLNKAELGRFKKLGVTPKRFVKEIRILPEEKFGVKEEIGVDKFNVGDYVDVTGVSIGKGFQGGIKRWHWKSGPKSHGSMSHRRVGSIGASSNPSRVFKGQHLPGHMGKVKTTVQNLEVIRVDKENRLLVVKGAVPGHKNSYLIIRKAKKRSGESKGQKE